MALKPIPKEFCQERKKKIVQLDSNQYSQFLELRCPECGKEIDLEVLINLFDKKTHPRRLIEQ